MPELHTQQQARDYLGRISVIPPQYTLHPFEYGWVISPDYKDRKDYLGLPKLVLDSGTGKVWQLPSWSVWMVMDAYRKALQQGTPPPGRQIYPHRVRVHLSLARDEPDRVEYQVRVEDLENPEQPERVYPLSIDKKTLFGQPNDQWSVMARDWVLASRTGQSWPATGMFIY